MPVQIDISLHEMLHAAGTMHEQSRAQDRNRLLSFNWAAVSSGNELNYQGYSLYNAREYDLSSVLQYGLTVDTGQNLSVQSSETLLKGFLKIYGLASSVNMANFQTCLAVDNYLGLYSSINRTTFQTCINSVNKLNFQTCLALITFLTCIGMLTRHRSRHVQRCQQVNFLDIYISVYQSNVSTYLAL